MPINVMPMRVLVWFEKKIESLVCDILLELKQIIFKRNTSGDMKCGHEMGIALLASK